MDKETEKSNVIQFKPKDKLKTEIKDAFCPFDEELARQIVYKLMNTIDRYKKDLDFERTKRKSLGQDVRELKKGIDSIKEMIRDNCCESTNCDFCANSPDCINHAVLQKIKEIRGEDE